MNNILPHIEGIIAVGVIGFAFYMGMYVERETRTWKKKKR